MLDIALLTHTYAFDPTYGYDLGELLHVGCPPAPAGLEEFWQNTYAEALRVELNITQREVASSAPNLRVFEVEFDSWNGRRLGGWITQPVAEPVRRLVVVGHGYGGRTEPDLNQLGPPSAAIFPCLRGQGRSTFSDIPEDAASHVLCGIESKETYVHRGCTADIWCAASVLAALFPTAADNLHYAGGSFGGGIGAMALAWDKRFRTGYLCVPSFGNHPLRLTLECVGSGESVRRYHQSHPEVTEVLAYFDAATMAQYISVPVLCDCALFDPAVPPPGQFAVYNAIRTVKDLFVRPAGHHAYEGELEVEALAVTWIDEWFARW